MKHYNALGETPLIFSLELIDKIAIFAIVEICRGSSVGRAADS